MNSKIKILIADDEELILLAWKKELESEGYKVITALNGKLAVEAAAKEKPDIVLTDLIMPEMNGVEVCRKIKEMYPDTQVVFVSGHPAQTEKQIMDFIAAGGRDEYLRKPLLKDEIKTVINGLVEERI
ncbi:alkaline phosphatase synthesis transcriptional regulatory protein PhoP [bacterium BMS3Abin09]|nr:alkaline phosphatase synthesis transcriptional regulatory protein PhoP [bacterium BMS3Abin09]GBE40355.1 alkaline phosphatase synthesis transcriptional regulatory protein PhoP [bacterium BMS3Bbin09]HDH34241.1 response regulator [Nitrospirota bacterium]HDN95234.1 response regulator [Nitrospirota bacterium]HDO66898.1 response regulator [Nitrospirota bacterium]